MSPWEFAAYIDGHNRSQSDKPLPPTDEEYDAAVRRSARIIESQTVH